LCTVQSWLKCEWAANSTVFNKLLSISNLGVYWQEVRITQHPCDTSQQVYSIIAKIYKSLVASDLCSSIENVSKMLGWGVGGGGCSSDPLSLSLSFSPARASTKAWHHARVQASSLQAPSGFYRLCRQRQWQLSTGVHPLESARDSGSRSPAKRYDFCPAEQQGISLLCSIPGP
jgi:hypothetical protein